MTDPPPYDPNQPAGSGGPWDGPPSGGYGQQGPWQEGQAWQQPGPYQQPYGYGPPPTTDGQAIAAMVLGIVGLVTAWFCGITILLCPAALIMGIISLRGIDRSQGRLQGKGFAVAGIATGGVGTLLAAAGVAFLVWWASQPGLGGF